jgi:hypothetical protein
MKNLVVFEERLAEELHKQYRATHAAMLRLSHSNMHDHGYSLCSKACKNYFRKRARLLLERANGKRLDGTIQEIQNQLASTLLARGLAKEP